MTAPTGSGWRHRHLLDVADLGDDEIEEVMKATDVLLAGSAGRAPLGASRPLTGRQVTILFYEASTRTRVSFEVAAKRLGAEVVNVSASTSSISKGESLADSVRTLRALGADVLVLRHARSGAAHLAARYFSGQVVNAGDGWHAHPTQALLDLYTLRRHLPERRVARSKVVILGDILHSRVARSNVWTLTAAGADLWLCGPATLLTGFEEWARCLPAGRKMTVTSDIDAALRNADAVMALRMQRERQESAFLPSLGEYTARYGLTAERLALARPGALVLHPGPMNEGVEIASDVASGPSSLVTAQVAHGVAVRMAVLALLLPAAAHG